MESGGGVEAMGMRSYCVIVDGGGVFFFFFFPVSFFLFPFAACRLQWCFMRYLLFFPSASHLPFPSLYHLSSLNCT